MPLSADCKYFLLPSSWILKWRNYISPSFKNPDIPKTLDRVIDSLMCEKHSQLVERPPQLVFRRGAIIQKESSASGLTIIPENDWRCFCEEWGATKTKRVSATIEHINNSGAFLTGSSDKMLICEDQLQIGHKVNGITHVICVLSFKIGSVLWCNKTLWLSCQSDVHGISVFCLQ
ncbi:unnamed protein product [Vicia faba]|uniref:DUSP domain-containing protein n=1 Tax=Vicia faba TaxID=3906 RepID=A0AAV1B4M2_VICFA|nr:unnamed protein product [Vicia faba]